jgi:hypothetical protein
MAKAVEKKTRVSKKALLRKLAEKTGRPLFHFDSLGRSNNLGKAVNIPPPCKTLCGG